MKYTISTTYVLDWELSEYSEYKFTKSGICINTKRGVVIKQVLNNRSRGYYIRGKFYSLNTIRKQLIKIKEIDCPF